MVLYRLRDGMDLEPAMEKGVLIVGFPAELISLFLYDRNAG
jgi:hypothetical protein